jgi:uncharacterized membrane protein YqjE
MTSRFASRSPSHSSDPKESPSPLSQLSQAVMSIVQARLELIGIELAEEKDRLLATVLLSVIAAMLGMVVLIGVTALVVILFWDSYKWQPLAVLSLVYLVICGACVLRVRRNIRTAPPAFELTRAEFEQDRVLFGRRVAERED